MKRPAKVQRTYHTRISDPDERLDEELGGYAEVYGRAERALFADLARGGDAAALKSEYLIRFGLTARQFNAIAINLKGKIASIRERRDGLIDEAKARIKTAEQVIAKLDQALSQPLEAAERHRRLSKPCACGFPTYSVRRATNTFASTSGSLTAPRRWSRL